jgi:hypothetical protein
LLEPGHPLAMGLCPWFGLSPSIEIYGLQTPASGQSAAGATVNSPGRKAVDQKAKRGRGPQGRHLNGSVVPTVREAKVIAEFELRLRVKIAELRTWRKVRLKNRSLNPQSTTCSPPSPVPHLRRSLITDSPIPGLTAVAIECRSFGPD